MKKNNKMNDEIKKLVNSSKVWVDYFGHRGGYCGYDDCVDILTKDDIKRDNISNVHVRFMDNYFGGVAIRLEDGAFRKLINGFPGCSNHEDLGDITPEDIKALMPIYNKEYLDRYSKAFEEDEWVDDMTADGMVGIRNDFFCLARRVIRGYEKGTLLDKCSTPRNLLGEYDLENYRLKFVTRKIVEDGITFDDIILD